MPALETFLDLSFWMRMLPTIWLTGRSAYSVMRTTSR